MIILLMFIQKKPVIADHETEEIDLRTKGVR